MNDNSSRFTRRSVAIGGGIAVALGLAAVGVNAPRWFRAKTAYDDLLNKLIDRDAAATVGHAVIRDMHKRYPIDGTPHTRDRDLVARELRATLRHRSLREQTIIDLAQENIFEAGGWVVPTTLAELCLLAAQVEEER